MITYSLTAYKRLQSFQYIYMSRATQVGKSH